MLSTVFTYLHPNTHFLPFSLSLINLMASVDVKHHVYLLHLHTPSPPPLLPIPDKPYIYLPVSVAVHRPLSLRGHPAALSLSLLSLAAVLPPGKRTDAPERSRWWHQHDVPLRRLTLSLLMTSLENNQRKCEIWNPEAFFLVCISMWKDFHQNAQYRKPILLQDGEI